MSLPTMTRRGFLGAAAGIGAAVLAGCSSGGSGGTGTIDVGVWGGADRAKLYQGVLDAYAATNPAAKATMQFADQAPYFERLTTAAASRRLPDIFWVTDTYFGRYAKAGALLDLKQYLGGAIDDTGLGTAGVAYGTVDGGTYGLPTHYNGVGTLIDDILFKDEGIVFEARTWSELADLATELSNPRAGVFGLCDNTTGVTQRGFENYVRQAGAELFTAEGKLGFGADVVAEWWDFWAKLRKARVIPTADVQIESEASGWTNDLLVTGKAAIRLASATHLNVAQALRKNPLSLHSFPETPGAAEGWRFFTPLILTAAGNTDAPEVVAGIMNHLLNDVEAAKTTKVNMGTPFPPAVSKAILPVLSPGDQTVVSYLTEQSGKPQRPSPTRPEAAEQFTAALSRASQEVAYGRQTPAAAAKTLIEQSAQYL